MCLTMDSMPIFIVKHICRRGTLNLDATSSHRDPVAIFDEADFSAGTRFLSSTSKSKLNPELDLPRWPSRKNFSELHRVRRCVGQVEIRMIEKVEDLGAKFQARLLAETEDFRE